MGGDKGSRQVQHKLRCAHRCDNPVRVGNAAGPGMGGIGDLPVQQVLYRLIVSPDVL